MISYRFKRRAFLTAMSGGMGLKILLRNMEAAAQTTKSPPRLLVTHWPVGIVAGSGDALWTPTSGSVGGSQGLQAFADAGLAADMTVIKGISTPGGQGGSHEGGTVALVTGVSPPGTRAGEAETDDAFSGGASFEQILLAQAGTPLKSPSSALSYKNLACDTRTDFGEYSTKTLCYLSTKQTPPMGVALGTGPENTPGAISVNPVNAYNELFSGFSPPAFIAGDGTAAAPRTADAMLTNLASKRSVLDFAAQELNALRTMGPADTRMLLDNHYNAVIAMENQLTNSINTSYPDDTGAGGAGGNMMGMAGMGGGAGGRGGAGPGGRGGTGGGNGGRGGGGGGGTTGAAGTNGTGGVGGQSCRNVLMAPPAGAGKADGATGAGNSYGDPTRNATDDAATIRTVGQNHFNVMKAAFICDVIRCGTFMWAPGTNHVGFTGMYPGSTLTRMHHPESHRIGTGDTTASATATSLGASAQFLYAVQKWFFTEHANNIKLWKTSYDGFGNSLLDWTVIPFVTEVLATGHERSRMPCMIIGGKALGYAHNRYQTGTYTVNQFWGTIGQAFGYTATAAPFAAPISGLWTKPP